MAPHSLLGASNAQALLGAWQDLVGQTVGGGQPLVGWQNSGQPTHIQHGMYGGHDARSFHPNFGGFGTPGYGARHGGHWGGHHGHGGFVQQAPQYNYGPGYTQYDASIPPRNMLVDRPSPSRADRVILPMSSGVNILPSTSAQITARPQNVAFRPERIVIGGTPGDWIVNDIKVGNQSQLSQSGDLPGEMFSATMVDGFISFGTVQTAMDFVIQVTFIGDSEGGAPFFCGVLGTAAV